MPTLFLRSRPLVQADQIAGYCSTTSSGNSLAVDLFGKCAASALPVSSIASTKA
jgi:hypothetical protein